MPDAGEVPQLSVVIATRNRANSLRALLEGLTRQSIPCSRFEVLVVDNDSSDTTAEVAAEFSTRFQHLRYSKRARLGAASARNQGIAQARGSRIVFLDDDIIPDPRLLEEHLAVEDKEGRIALLGAVRFPWE